MARIHLKTLGCRLNQAESERILQMDYDDWLRDKVVYARRRRWWTVCSN